MNIQRLLNFAYDRIYNSVGDEIYELGEYSFLMQRLIYTGITYLNTEMKCYDIISGWINVDFIYHETVKNEEKENIPKEFNINIPANKTKNGKWVKYTFDSSKYFQEYLETDILNKQEKIKHEIESSKKHIENYKRIIMYQENELKKVNKAFSDIFITY